MSKITISTNNRPRLLLDANQLTPRELDNLGVTREDEGSFFRYKRQAYNLADFEHVPPSDHNLQGWTGIRADSFFSAVLVRIRPSDPDWIIVGWMYAS